jgi:transcriptional regulator with XRE-family HTH domain
VTEHAALGDFLRNRRGRLQPADVGLAAGAGRRQTTGLRREELATLAGVSVDYYIRLEQGRDTHPSAEVLDALAAVLRLDGDERAHLHGLARRPVPRSHVEQAVVRPGLRRLLHVVRPAPAYVIDAVSTVLAANPEGWQLMVGLDDWPAPRRNIIRYAFTHPSARKVFGSWAEITADCVADLRSAATPRDAPPELDALVAELCADSPHFAELWRGYDVRLNYGACRVFHHPEWGRRELTSEILTAGNAQRFLIFQDV